MKRASHLAQLGDKVRGALILAYRIRSHIMANFVSFVRGVSAHYPTMCWVHL
jgi:hypothetical protein